MNLQQLLHTFHNRLDEIYGNNEVDSFFNILLEFYLKLKRTDYILNPKLEISKENQEILDNVLNRLQQQEPIQYIIGETYFFGFPFKVTKHTLIPRPETEELVAWILQTCKKENPTILDIGTGSGCIALSLAKKIPKAQVYAVDISKKAINVAKDNAELNNVEIQFIKDSILKPASTELISSSQPFDIIVSNPPYVREQEKNEMKPNVLQYEPHEALFVTNDNPLQFYEAITNFAVKNLRQKGFLFFEINQYLGKETQQLLLASNFDNITLKKDLFGNDRMLKANKKQ